MEKAEKNKEKIEEEEEQEKTKEEIEEERRAEIKASIPKPKYINNPRIHGKVYEVVEP